MAKGYALTGDSIRKLRRLVQGGSSVGALPNAKVAPLAPDRAPPPFTVRWSQSENDGSGSWVIWLPDPAALVMFGDSYIDDIDGVTAADNLPEGWYVIDDAESTTDEIFLVVTVDESTGAATAEIATEGGTASTGEKVFNILVATMETDSSTGMRRVHQHVVGAVTLGAVTLGASGGDEFSPSPFDIGETQREAVEGEEGDENGNVTVAAIVNCKFFWDGVEKSLPDYSPLPGGTATIYLRCVGTESQSASAVNGYTWTFSLGTSAASSGGDIYRNYKIYDFTNGEVTMDWRDTFLALYSNTDEQVEPDGVSIDKIPDAAQGATPDGDEGKLEIKGWKSATATELTLGTTATTELFPVKASGGGLEYRTLKVPASGGGTDISALNGVTLVTNVKWIGSPTYAIRVTKRACTVANNVLSLGNAQTTDILTTPLSKE